MPFLVRKISRGKWPEEICTIDNIQGDAIADLKTSGNTLSLWMINSTEELDLAVLALATASEKERIETINIVYIDEKILIENSFVIDDKVSGDTAMTKLENTHRDLCKITYGSLGILSKIIIEEIKNEHVKIYTRSTLQKLLNVAYKEGRIDKTKCKDKLLSEIKK